ncbi:MAG: hypothetical protein JW818_12215 [Pirellulales bacterium]|nr:hypothetical protein [Pirellulales bacterium]
MSTVLVGFTVAARWRRMGITTPTEFLRIRFTEPIVQAYTWIGMLEASAVGLTDLTAAGTKPLALGNAPDSAFSNRSFIGYVDTVRFTDETLGPAQFLNAVPEPSLAVYLVGLLGLVWFHRYRAGR